MNMKRDDTPRFPFKLLQLLCEPSYYIDIEGDLYELYDRDAATLSRRRATFRLYINVLRLIRPGLLRSFFPSRSFNRTPMFKHNILIALRNFRRYKTSFIVNVVGLSTGLTCVLLIGLWISDEMAMDRFHVNKDRLYQVCENVTQNGGVITRLSTSGPTAEALLAEYPEVEMAIMSKMEWIETQVLTVGETNIKARELYADTDFFRMFSFPLAHGNPATALKDKSGIVISEDVAIRLFGTTENVIGKMVEMNHKTQFQVTGVMKDITKQASVSFDFVLNFDGFRDQNQWMRDWGSTAPQTHVLLREGADFEAVNSRISTLVIEQTDSSTMHRRPFLRKVSDGYLYNRYEDGKLAGGRIEYVKLFGIIATFILLIACINFMNLSTARASRRAKEVGVKKVIGARQGSLIGQYLAESTLVAFLSLGIALVLAWLLLPKFNLLTDKHLALTLDSPLLPYLPVVVLATGLLAGSYPALYLTKFKPVTVLRGKLTGMMGEVLVRKGLVMFQFTLSIILIVSVMVVSKQISFVQTQNLGYNRDNVIILAREGAVRQDVGAFIEEVKRVPGVVTAAAASHDMTGHNSGTSGIRWPGKDPNDRTEFERITADVGLLELLEFEIVEGRSFLPGSVADKQAIIFNESAIQFMGMKDPIGRKIELNEGEYEIIGVIKDFNYETFHEPMKPAFIWLRPDWTGSVMIRLEPGNPQETLAGLEKFYNTYNPGFPFTYRFIDDDYQKMYAAENRVGQLSRYFAGLAILISCLGLFGLAAFTAERRIKEIGIRKVMGSTTLGIVYLLSLDLTKMVMIAILVGLPLSAWLANQWLGGFAFRIELEWWFFVVSGATALLIAWVTVTVQTMKAAGVNPSECLRAE
jgi:putative ABC transport system permease protein